MFKVGDKLIWKQYRRFDGLMAVKEVKVLKVYKDASVQVSELPKGENRFRASGMAYGRSHGRVERPKEGETLETLQAQIDENNAERERQNKEREEKQQRRFNKAIEATQNAKDSLTLIDSFEDTEIYKIIAQSERGERMIGIFKVSPHSWYEDALEINLTYSKSVAGSWPSLGSFRCKDFSEALSKVLYELYYSW